MLLRFRNTVATRRFQTAQNGRGWLGIRFQAHPREQPSEVIIHAHLLDRTAEHEREALGILGVNLIHAAFYEHAPPEHLIGSLMDDLSRERVEIDMIKLSGPVFAGVDGHIVPIRSFEESYLSISTQEVLALIEKDDPSWERLVPPTVAETIRSKRLFRPHADA